ncbi:hypothetical protein V1517DRAFT_367386 [Lipomyces orientalis]|uniref:Uncharacterized protein n=1 Tax=Lipomyces orientalis TaxID=1233043 RepID=A0ACC3TQ20_9ASCO
MAGRRAIGRDPDTPLGGMMVNRSVTEKNFLFMLGILIDASDPYRVTLRSTGGDLMPTDDALKPSHYDIRPYSRRGNISSYKSSVTDEPCITRVLSRTITGRDAHIFPVSSEECFVQNGFSRWITNRIVPRDTGLNSCQNGLLLQSHIHQSFDAFDFSVNPDDGYKTTCFDEDPFSIDGRTLDGICRILNDEKSVRDELLRWHFRQAVLAKYEGSWQTKL